MLAWTGGALRVNGGPLMRVSRTAESTAPVLRGMWLFSTTHLPDAKGTKATATPPPCLNHHLFSTALIIVYACVGLCDGWRCSVGSRQLAAGSLWRTRPTLALLTLATVTLTPSPLTSSFSCACRGMADKHPRKRLRADAAEPEAAAQDAAGPATAPGGPGAGLGVPAVGAAADGDAAAPAPIPIDANAHVVPPGVLAAPAPAPPADPADPAAAPGAAAAPAAAVPAAVPPAAAVPAAAAAAGGGVPPAAAVPAAAVPLAVAAPDWNMDAGLGHGGAEEARTALADLERVTLEKIGGGTAAAVHARAVVTALFAAQTVISGALFQGQATLVATLLRLMHDLQRHSTEESRETLTRLEQLAVMVEQLTASIAEHQTVRFASPDPMPRSGSVPWSARCGPGGGSGGGGARGPANDGVEILEGAALAAVDQQREYPLYAWAGVSLLGPYGHGSPQEHWSMTWCGYESNTVRTYRSYKQKIVKKTFKHLYDARLNVADTVAAAKHVTTCLNTLASESGFATTAPLFATMHEYTAALPGPDEGRPTFGQLHALARWGLDPGGRVVRKLDMPDALQAR